MRIFFEPSIKEITKNSIIRIDTKQNLQDLEILKFWKYKVVDKFENTYYIKPIKKVDTVLTIEYDENISRDFNYNNSRWETLDLSCYIIKIEAITEAKANALYYAITSVYGSLSGCVEEEKTENSYVIIDTCNQKVDKRKFRKYLN